MVAENLLLLKEERTLDKNVSSRMKGVLILLIILGHNSVLTKCVPGLFSYLYSFHVILFFILPWFYNHNKPTLRKSLKRCAKLYGYYTLFFVIQIVAYNVLIENNFSLENSLHAFVVGGHHALKVVTGYEYLWFIPAFCVSMLMCDLYLCVPVRRRVYINILALIIVCVFTQLRYQDYNALIQGVFFAAIGIIATIMYNRVFVYVNKTVSIILVIIASAIFVITPFDSCVALIMPFIAFFALWNICELYGSRGKWIARIGSLSMLIYLIHPLIFQLLIRVIPSIANQLLYGVCILVLTIAISVPVSYFINKEIIKRHCKGVFRGTR